MASFTEQATLKVVDKSSAQIRKINAELKKLFATAKSLKSTNVNINVNARGVQQATAAIRQLNAEITRLKASARSINLRVNTGNLSAANQQINTLNRNLRTLGQHRTALHVQTAGLVAAMAQINRLRAAAAHPINVRTGHTGGGGGGAGGYGRPAAARGIGGLVTGIGGAFTFHQIGAAIGRAMKEGASDISIGDTSLAFKQLDRVYGAGADQAVKDAIIEGGRRRAMEPGGAFFNLGQRTLSYSEALGVTGMQKDAEGKWDTRAASFLTDEMESFTEILVGLGKTFDDAREQAISYGKGMEQAGRMTDPRTGKFDIKRATESFDYLRQLMPTIGKEMTGDFVKNMIKYMSSTKYPASNEALGAVLLMGEEMGTRAAVGYNQAVKQLSGQNVDKLQFANLMAAGLITSETRPMPGGGKRKIQVVTGVKDEKLLREDAPKWVQKNLMPLLEKEGQDLEKAAAKREGRKISPADLIEAGKKYAADPSNVTAFAAKYVSERTAREAVAAMLYRGDEIQRQLNEAAARSGKKEDYRKADEFGIQRAAYQMQNQMQGMAGEMVRAVAPILVPAMQQVSEKMRTSAEGLRTGTIKPSEFISSIGTDVLPAAMGAALMGLATPAAGPLGLAAAALSGAALLLISAANAWLKYDFDALFKGKDPFATPLTQEQKDAKVAQSAAEDANTQLRILKEHRDATVMRDARGRGEQAQKQKYLRQLDAQIKALEQRAAEANQKAAEAQAIRDAQRKKEEETTADRAARDDATRPPGAPPVFPPPTLPAPTGTQDDPFTVRPQEVPGKGLPLVPRWMTDPQSYRFRGGEMPGALSPNAPYAQPLGPPDTSGKPVKVIPVVPEGKPLAVTPTEPAKPIIGPQPSISQPPPSFFGPRAFDMFKQGPPVTPITPQPLSNFIDSGSVSTLFSSTFTSGATTIGNSGTTVGSNAASELNGQAGGIGGAIGRAAAAIISSATVNVNIPNQTAKADTAPMQA